MEVLGSVAAIVQISGHAISAARLAKNFYQEFRDAPDELQQLAAKTDLVKSQVDKIEKLGVDLTGAELEGFLPSSEVENVSGTLCHCVQELGNIHGLANLSRSRTLRSRLSWASVEKRRAETIVKKTTTMTSLLDTSLHLLNSRANVLTQRNMGAIRTGQDTLIASVTRIQTLQIQSAASAQSHMDLTRATSDLLQEALLENQQYRSQQMAQTQAMNTLVSQQIQLQQMITERFIPQDKPTSTGLQNYSNHQGQHVPAPPIPSALVTCDEQSQQNQSGQLYVPRSRTRMRNDRAANSSSIGYESARIELKKIVRGCQRSFRLKFYLHVLNRLALQTQFRFDYSFHSWLPVPGIRVGLTAINIRAADDNIFNAIQCGDVDEVKRLFDVGEASAHDVSEAGGVTLLGVLMDSFEMIEFNASKKLATILLRAGCDPNVYSHNNSSETSLIGLSLQLDVAEIPDLLFTKGADVNCPPALEYLSVFCFEQYDNHLDRLLYWDALDWSEAREDSQNRLLSIYCYHDDPQLIVRAIEEQGLDINCPDTPSALVESLVSDSLRIATVLLAYGANLNSVVEAMDISKNIIVASQLRELLPSITHFLLKQGMNASILWEATFGWTMGVPGSFYFDQKLCLALHILYHGGSCHFDASDQMELLRKLAPRGAPLRAEKGDEGSSVLCLAERQKTVWTENGLICMDKFIEQADIEDVLISRTPDSTDKQVPRHDTMQSAILSNEPPINDGESGQESDYDRSIAHNIVQDYDRNGRRLLSSSSKIHNTPEGPHPQHAILDSHGFQNVISTREGRQRLARWPLATVFYTAITIAGYAAEMDDEGDIWWTDDDCERYYDALESQTCDNDTDIVANCPICQNLDGWGLGEMKEKEEDGLRFLRERQQGIKPKVNWPSNYSGHGCSSRVEEL